MRRLILDGGQPEDLAAELRARGRDAAHVSELGLDSATDAEVLAADGVLITTAPIKGAVVEIHRAEFTGNATTSADGRFQAACTSGHFSISVSAIGHNPASKEIDVPLGRRVETTITLPRVPTASG